MDSVPTRILRYFEDLPFPVKDHFLQVYKNLFISAVGRARRRQVQEEETLGRPALGSARGQGQHPPGEEGLAHRELHGGHVEEEFRVLDRFEQVARDVGALGGKSRRCQGLSLFDFLKSGALQ